MATPVTFGSASAAPGTKAFGWIELTMMADGSPLRFPVHVIAGSKPGPRVTVLSAQHGYEITEIEVCRRTIEAIDPKTLSGTVVVVPVANPIAFEGGTRSTWIDSLYGDNGNMNRVWPGRPDGWITERMVWTLGEQLIKGSDAIIDLHNGTTAPPGLTIYYGYAFTSDDAKFTSATRGLAAASGFELLIDRAVPSLAGSLGSYAASLKIPFFACEIGEFYGLQLNGEAPPEKPERSHPECGVTAILNMLKHLGMLEGKPVLPKRQVLVSPENNLRPKHGGALYSEFKADAVGRVIPKGTLLGTVVSPYDFKVLDEIRAPYEQNMILAITHRHPFARVNAGDYAYICADMATAQWIENA